MKIRQNILIGLVALVTIVIILILVFQPRSINWAPSFSQADKIPYGNYILSRVLPSLFPDKTITEMNAPIYNCLLADTLWDENYIIINTEFRPDELDARELMRFVAAGNYAFIAANSFGPEIADTLKLDIGFKLLQNDSLRLNFVNPAVRSPREFIFRRGMAEFYFTGFDTANTVILATNHLEKPNYIQVNFGKGAFLLNSAPLAFTNYNMLFRNNADYISRALSYLPVRDIYWDEYYKVGKQLLRTPLKFILTQESLKWAYGAGMSALLLFILVEAKRRQRAIPIVQQPVNDTLSFVTTVGRLYYQNRDHKDLVEKKITFFLDTVRRQLYLKTSEFSKSLYHAVATKSGLAEKEVEELFGLITLLRQMEKIAEADLHKMNSLLEKFYSHLKEAGYGSI